MANTEYSGVLKQVDDSGNVVSLYPTTKKVETTIAMLNTAEGFVVDALVVKEVLSKLGGCWIDCTDADGNPTTEPYVHWLEEDGTEVTA